MKKLFKSIIISAALLMGTAAVAPSASATWSGHQTSKKVRVYTDETTYSSRATSVDWKAEKSTAGRVYYSAMLIRSDNYSNSSAQRGNFITTTPLKKFSLSGVKPGTYRVIVNIYSDSNERNYIGSASSAKLYIK
ncbi:hypothetical protein P4T89_03560 [Bacillus nakamurai]|uniref:Uncharacterized protein n=1 Tax=Bacillus nakamurai TaxID=1793963 RepID=A0A150F9P9_9BACI|nr:hypothetical protein [Bacillus nakamurai]KXZ21821.1 hypothetical protein AXI58_12845 [Bacillus nakamurai]MED1226706.1 hypothetical protein [Bacillus nakamurai]